MNEFANWTVLASLVVRGAFVSAESEIHIERHPKSLPLLIEFTITFAKHVNFCFSLSDNFDFLRNDYNCQ